MIREKNAFSLMLVINRKLISYTILAPRRSLLVKMLFFMKRSSGHVTKMVFNNRFLLILMERMKMEGSNWWRMNSSRFQQLPKKRNNLNVPKEDQHGCRTMRRAQKNWCKVGLQDKAEGEGEVDKYKASLVAKGHKQEFDVKLAFLHGDLKEEVFIDQPPGYVKLRNEHKVYRVGIELSSQLLSASNLDSPRFDYPESLRLPILRPPQLPPKHPTSIIPSNACFFEYLNLLDCQSVSLLQRVFCDSSPSSPLPFVSFLLFALQPYFPYLSLILEYPWVLTRVAKHLKDLLSEGRIFEFQRHFSIPDDVHLSLVMDNTLDMERDDQNTIVFPLLSIAEGRVRFPLHPFLRAVLRYWGLIPSQPNVNFFRIITGFVELNWRLGINLGIPAIRHCYALAKSSDRLGRYFLRAKDTDHHLESMLASSGK
ncbi:hypothetical protein CsSME_00046919 [Camellia sinensis var. sinensis]